MELKVKLYLVDEEDEKFMGIGVLWLLEAIERNGSLRAAASDMGLSYTKAYNMLERLEKNLGHDIVLRRKGGSSREGAILTPFAKEFMTLYRDFQGRVKELAGDEYKVFHEKLRAFEEL